MTLTLEQLREALKAYPEIPLAEQEQNQVRGRALRSQSNGARIHLDEVALNAGQARILVPPLKTQFVLRKFVVKRSWWGREVFSLLTLMGSIDGEVWYIKDKGVTLETALRVFDLSFADIEQAWTFLTVRSPSLGYR